MNLHSLLVKILGINTPDKAFCSIDICLGLFKKWMLQGKVIELICENSKYANLTFDWYHNKISLEQRYKLLNAFTNFGAYKYLSNLCEHRCGISLTYEERELLFDIMIDENKEDEEFNNTIDTYILSLLKNSYLFTEPQIKKINDIILKNNDAYLANYFYKCLEYYKRSMDVQELQDKLVPLLIIDKLSN